MSTEAKTVRDERTERSDCRETKRRIKIEKNKESINDEVEHVEGERNH